MPNHVWSYDFVSSTRPLPSGSSEGSTLPTVGNPGRCDDPTWAAGICSVHNGPEFIALALRGWISALELPRQLYSFTVTGFHCLTLAGLPARSPRPSFATTR